jgi:hypothetical protein
MTDNTRYKKQYQLSDLFQTMEDQDRAMLAQSAAALRVASEANEPVEEEEELDDVSYEPLNSVFIDIEEESARS